VLAAHVHTRKDADGLWTVDRTSPFNPRIIATTPMRLSGPIPSALGSLSSHVGSVRQRGGPFTKVSPSFPP
jgi:hypothetical protein